jgi:Pentapeptide repeats (8 copies)
MTNELINKYFKAFDTAEELASYQPNFEYTLETVVAIHSIPVEELVKWIKENKGKKLYLVHADFSGADCSGADFSGANLNCAFFNGAYVSRADFRGANLRRVDFGDVDYSKDAFPKDFNPRQQGMILNTITVNGKEYQSGYKFTEHEKMDCFPEIQGFQIGIHRLPSMKIEYMWYEKDNRYEGLMLDWDVNHNSIRMMRFYKDGLPFGKWREWSTDSQPCGFEINHENGVIHGVQLWHGRDGDPQIPPCERYYNNGIEITKEEYEKQITN